MLVVLSGVAKPQLYLVLPDADVELEHGEQIEESRSLAARGVGCGSRALTLLSRIKQGTTALE